MVEHVCGLMGFNGMLGDKCPACETRFKKKMKCEHYWVEDFSIGPITERWFRCIFCGVTKKV